MVATTDEAVIIACDESGAEGENITRSKHPAFVHASVRLDPVRAAEIMAGVRRLAPSQAEEYKSQQILRPSAAARSAVSWLLTGSGLSGDDVSVLLVDKEYFVVSKVVDLFIEEMAHAVGIDLYRNGRARTWALTLRREGPRAFPSTEWQMFLDTFNSFMRTHHRRGGRATLEQFFGAVDRLRLRSTGRDVDEIIGLLWATKEHAYFSQQQIDEGVGALPTLDPLFAALGQTIRSWYDRDPRPVHLVHDEQKSLLHERMEMLAWALSNPLPELRHIMLPVPVVAVEQVDSRRDSRVQVADLFAGVARIIASTTLDEPHDDRARLLHPFVDVNSIWSDSASFTALTGRELPR